MIIASIYNRTKTEKKAQVFGVLSAEITHKLSDVSHAFIEIGARNPHGELNTDITLDNLQEMNRIELWHNDGEKEELFFDGYISSVEATWSSIKVHCSSLAGILDYRIIKNSKRFSGVAVKTLLSTLWNEMNDPPLTLKCEANEMVNKTYEIGRSILDILRDFVSGGFEYRIKGNELTLGKNIGNDKSTAVQYRKEWQSPREWNISDASLAYSASNTHNYILTKIASSPPYHVSDSTSISKYGYKEKYITVSGDQGITPSGYLADHKESSREIAFTPIDNQYTHIEVGDWVGVYLDSGNEIMQFAGVVKVSEKAYYLNSDLPQIKITVSTSNSKNLSVLEKVKSLDSRISNLETAS